jgi:iron complex transport system ATP-binding protein
MKELLSARNVSAGYGSRQVLRDVSISLSEGDFLGVLGPNGSGKTTLVRVLSGVLKPGAGEVFWKERPLQGIPRAQAAREIAVVGQSPPSQLDLPVEEIVALGRLPHFTRFQWTPGEEDRQAIERAMETTGIADLRQRNFQSLSGGERQRVMIALALSQEPRAILLDEPTVHLDVAHQAEILDLIAAMNRDQGLAVLAVLHDLNLAGAFCRRLVFLKAGRILREGRPAELLAEAPVRELFGRGMGVLPNPQTGIPVLYPVRGQEVKR